MSRPSCIYTLLLAGTLASSILAQTTNAQQSDAASLETPLAAAPKVMWSAAPDLPIGRARGQLVKVADGSLVAIGGDLGLSDPTLVHALRFGASTWSVLPNLDAQRFGQGATAGPGGTVFQFGGWQQDNLLRDAYTYNPGTGGIDPRSAMVSVRADFGSASDSNGRAYAFGGSSGSSTTSAAERFDPVSGNWTPLASMPVACAFCSAAWDGSDSIYVFTGFQNADSVLRYTISTNHWTTAAPAPVSTTQSAAVLGGDGRIYLIGGVDYQYTPVATVQAYDPQGDVWSVETPLPQPVFALQGTTDTQGRIVAAGGYSDSNNTTSLKTWRSQPLVRRNSAPVFTSSAPTTAIIGTQYSYALRASGFPAPAYSLLAGPSGMTMRSGVISWVPSPREVGTFTVEVKASNTQGSTTQSYTLNVVPPVPPSPTGLSPRTTTSVSVLLSWSAVNYPYVPLTYNVYQWVSSGGRIPHWFWLRIASGLHTTSYTVTGLTAGKTYRLAVASAGPGGTSSLSPALSVTTLFPGAPTNLTASAVTARSATLSWTAGKGTEPSANFSIYSGSGKLVTSKIAATHLTISNLSPSTNYSFYVVAYDLNMSASSPSRPVFVTTQAK